MTDIKAEIVRRQSNTAKVYTLLRERVGTWVNVHELARVGGFSAWRTRVSDARDLCSADEEIIWNGKTAESAYMLRPKSLGRDASDFAPRNWTTDGPFTDGFRLTPPE